MVLAIVQGALGSPTEQFQHTTYAAVTNQILLR